MQSDGWLIAFIVGVVQGAFLSAALLTMKTGNRRATIVLSALVAVFTVLILGEVIDHLMHSRIEILIMGANINTELAIGPLLLLLVQSILDPDRPFGRADARHFLPWLLGLAGWLGITGAMYLGMLSLTEAALSKLIAGYVVFKAAFLFAYLAVTSRTLTRGLRHTPRFVAGRQPVELQWLKPWCLGVGVIAGFIYLAFFLGYFGVPVPESDDVGSLVLALMIYLLSFLVLRRPWILFVRPRRSDVERYAADIERLERHLERDRSFLDPDLAASRLAASLGITENRLSAILNDGLQTSFYELLGRYRLEEFECLARDPANRERSVLELAFAAGFNSKASFYRLFRRSHGTTPTAYRKAIAC